MSDPIYAFEVETLDGEKKSLSDYEGRVMLVVNTASQCGFTPQYKGLEKLHRGLADRGLVVLGFPCNQFGAQEPGSSKQILQFCEDEYDVTFPMHAKIDVNGADAHPLYEHLKKAKRGVLGSSRIKWNFTKFLVDKTGKVVERFASTKKPSAIRARIEELL